jgi:inosose dehydratase
MDAMKASAGKGQGVMPQIHVGCGQITWNQFAAAGGLDEEQVLSEIAQAGYEGAPAGPSGGRSAEQTVALYGRYGLKPAPGYLGADFWKEDQRESILERASHLASFTRQVGCTELYVAAGGFDYVTSSGRARSQLAGHVGPEDAMTDEEFERFGLTLNEVGAATLREGVRSCFHNHVGTVIETREEIDRLLSLADPELVFLGPDTGHLAWAGADVVAFCGEYADRIKTLHLKDVDESVARQGRAEGWDYGTFNRNGVFAELGEGDVDFPAIFEILRGVGFGGWVIAETDVTQKPTALESATISRNYLKSIGI